MPAKPSKTTLLRMVDSRPGADEHPGYFDDAGMFVRGPFYTAQLGGQAVALVGSRGYRQDIGFYTTRDAAVTAAKELKAKARQWLGDGNYTE